MLRKSLCFSLLNLSLAALAQNAPLPQAPAPSVAQSATPTPAPPPAAAGALTWAEVQARFRQANPFLQAAAIGVDESRANEITAHLRPNPDLNLQLDQVTVTNTTTSNPLGQPDSGWQPVANSYPNLLLTYLHERGHKRELRTDSAKQATLIAVSNQSDLLRNLNYDLRSSFVQVLQAKAVLALTRDNLEYYDHFLQLSRDRLKAGDIAQVDMDRLDLGRVSYESDYQLAEVNLRTAKIHLLQLLNDRTPVDRFDVTGPFTFSEALDSLDHYHQLALSVRPDLQAALQAVDKARIDHKLAIANGTTDPVFGFDAAHQPNPLNSYIGVSVNVPLRIFDRNQGEKRRTLLDIDLQQRQAEAARAQVFADVDSAYTTVGSQLRLLRHYKTKYLDLAAGTRDTIAFSYQHGGASLLDFFQAQSDYRRVQLGYLNLVGAYLTAAAQLNLAVGQEVLQ